MTDAWYPGIKAFCAHWYDAPMLQQTFASMEQEFSDENDACIDAAKAMVECSCRILIEELDDPSAPLKPSKSDVPLAELLGLATRLLDLGEIRDRAFANLIREHNRLSDALRELRNKAGTLSHGKDGFVKKLSVHHRRAAILAADAIVTFLHEAYLEREPDPARTLEPFERFRESSSLIDRYSQLSANIDDDGILRAIVSLPSGDVFDLAVTTSELLFGVDREAFKFTANVCREASEMNHSAQPDNPDVEGS